MGNSHPRSLSASADGGKGLSLFILLIAAAGYLLIALDSVFTGRTWTDEVTYLAKGLWYVQGRVHPYTAQDATWYMPLYFYQLGIAEALFGAGHVTGRMMSVVLGLGSGGVLFMLVRRLSGNAAAAAMAVLIYLATPTTAYYFATAAPLAVVALLHVLTIWLMVENRERRRLWISAVIGALLAAMFFYRQNMILAAIVLVPAYLTALPAQRGRHAAILIGTALIFTLGIIALFPTRLIEDALRLPVVTSVLDHLGLLSADFRLIVAATETPYSLNINLGALSWRDPFDGFLLPYGGTILLALAYFFVVPRDRRLLALAPLYFLYLALVHYLGSVGYCAACILTYTSYFIATGALAAGLCIAEVGRRYAEDGKPSLSVMTAACIVAVAINATATGFAVPVKAAVPEAYKFFPAPMLRQVDREPEFAELGAVQRMIADATPPDACVLVVHSLPALPYAVFTAGRLMPPQSLNIKQSFRRLKPELTPEERAAATRAAENESMWTEDTLQRWMARDMDVILYDEASGILAPDVLAADFNAVGHGTVDGRPIGLYVRKTPTRAAEAPCV